MKKISIAVFLALLVGCLGANFAGAQAMTGMDAMVTLNAQNGSGQNGSATLHDNGDGTTTVTISVAPGAAGVAQPAHIHEGTCANLNPTPKYPLNNVVDGKSVTTVKVSMADLSAGAYAINIHKSGPEAAVYVSCGDLASMMMMPAGSTTTAPANAASITVQLSAQNGSGQNGSATLTDLGNNQTQVVLNITSGATGVAQPAHIHEGTCANLNPTPKYPLSNVVNGQSTTTVNVSLQALMSGTYAINVHKSGPEASVYVSCGDLTAMAMPASNAAATTVQLSAQNGSGQNGTAVLTDLGNGKTQVVLNITSGATGVPQPAHIHDGTCANLNPTPKYPLSNVVNGQSTTVVNVSLEALMSGTYAINVHKSGPEASVYVACGNIMSMAVVAPAPTPVAVAPGMPTTGNGGEGTLLFGLVALLLVMIGSGIMLRRRA